MNDTSLRFAASPNPEPVGSPLSLSLPMALPILIDRSRPLVEGLFFVCYRPNTRFAMHNLSSPFPDRG